MRRSPAPSQNCFPPRPADCARRHDDAALRQARHAGARRDGGPAADAWIVAAGPAAGGLAAAVVLSALWPVLLNASSAVRQIDPVLLDVARSFRLGPAGRLTRVILPAIVPSLLIGIRVAIPLAIVVTLLVEMLTSLPGVGAIMIMSQRNFQSSEVYALLVLVGLFGFVVNDLFALVERAILRRRPPRG